MITTKHTHTHTPLMGTFSFKYTDALHVLVAEPWDEGHVTALGQICVSQQHFPLFVKYDDLGTVPVPVLSVSECSTCSPSS